jgi:hypothetical protein
MQQNFGGDILTRIALLGAVVLFGIAASFSAAKSQPLQSPACLYKSETYTEGAYLYPGRLLLLTCSVDAGRPVWKVVPTNRLSELRLQGSNLASGIIPESSGTPNRVPPASAEDEGRPKCFAINGSRYCQ